MGVHTFPSTWEIEVDRSLWDWGQPSLQRESQDSQNTQKFCLGMGWVRALRDKRFWFPRKEMCSKRRHWKEGKGQGSLEFHNTNRYKLTHLLFWGENGDTPLKSLWAHKLSGTVEYDTHTQHWESSWESKVGVEISAFPRALLSTYVICTNSFTTFQKVLESDFLRCGLRLPPSSA